MPRFVAQPPAARPEPLHYTRQRPVVLEQVEETTGEPAPRSDPQNVHDSCVAAATRAMVRDMADASGTSKDDAKDTARRIILDSQLSAEEKQQALDVVDNLTSSTHSRIGHSEVRALDLVLGRISQITHQPLQDNLRETLVKQLAGCVERGHVVCSSGKISRIVATLDGADLSGVHSPVPMWMVREEIGSKAAQMRDTAEDSDTTKTRFQQWVRDTYRATLGDDIVQPLVDEFLLGF
jgi:hypothetical protein